VILRCYRGKAISITYSECESVALVYTLRQILVVGRSGRQFLEDLGVDGTIILKCILNRMAVHGLDSFGSGEEQLWAPVNTVMNLWVS